MQNCKLFYGLVLGFWLFTFSGESQIIPAGVSISRKVPGEAIKVKPISSGITNFVKVGIQMAIPAGWMSVGADSASLFGLSHNNIVSLKNGKDCFASFWKGEYTGNPSQEMEDDLSRFAPLHFQLKSLYITGDGPSAFLYIWKAYHIHEGKRQYLTIITGYKQPPTFKPFTGIARLFSVSYSEDKEGQFEADIVKFIAHIQITDQVGIKEVIKNERMAETGLEKIENTTLTGQQKDNTAALVTDTINKAANILKPISKEYDVSMNWTKDLRQIKEFVTAWQVRCPATVSSNVAETILIPPCYLLLSYNDGVIAMVDTRSHLLLWHHKDTNEQCFHFASGDENAIIMFRNSNPYILKDNYPYTITAYETVSGKEKWSTQLNYGQIKGWIPVQKPEILIAVNQEKRETHLTAVDMNSGEKRWEINQNHSSLKKPPFPIQIADKILIFGKGVEFLSSDKGLTVWKNEEIQLDDMCPLPQIINDTVYIFDKNHTLYWLDINTGISTQNMKLRTSADYTYFSRLYDRIYLRGMTKNDDGSLNYFIDAINNKDAKNLWSYSDSVPTISNLIDKDGIIYTANWKGPIALNRDSGKKIFNTEVSEVGKSYPVLLLNYGDTLVYIGEMVIAGVEGSTGRIIFRNTFDPVSQTVHCDGTDLLITRLSEYLKHFGTYGKKGKVSVDPVSLKGLADDSYRMSRASQERASSLKQESQKLYKKYRSGYGTEGGLTQSDMKIIESESESMAAQRQWAAGVAISIYENVGTSMMEFVGPERDRLTRIQSTRDWLNDLYGTQLAGDFSVRINQEDNFCNFEIVHLPSGEIIHKQKIMKERALEETEWGQKIILDPVNNTFYYHELRMVAGFENSVKNADNPVPHAIYLVAAPLVHRE